MDTIPPAVAKSLAWIAIVACGTVLGGCNHASKEASSASSREPSVEANLVLPALKTPEAFEHPPVAVATAPAEMHEVERWIDVPIDLAPYRIAVPAAEASGRVIAVNFEVGDAVKDGAVLAQVDDSIARLEVTRDEAALERGKVFAEECAVVFGKAERDVSRMEALAEGGQASESELDAARVAVASARSRVAQARNEVLALETTLRASRRMVDRMAVKAPFAGVVVAKKVELGGWTEAGGIVAEVHDVATLEAMIRIPESLVYVVKANETKARVRVPFAGVEVETPILRIVRDVSGHDRGFNAWLRLDNKDGRLVPGMNAVCYLPTRDMVASLVVPIEAVSPGVGGEPDRVCAVLDDDRAIWIPLKRWYAFDGKAVLIDRVVSPHTRVIVQGAENVPLDSIRAKVIETPVRDPTASEEPQPKLDSRKPE